MNGEMVTIYANMFDKKPNYITVNEAIRRIKTGRSAVAVKELRETIDHDRQKNLKFNLPAVSFSGKFEDRTDDSLLKHSNLIVLDFDDVEHPEEKKVALMGLKYVFASWISPSGNGVKALVRIADPKKHREHFAALKEDLPEIDPSGVNPCRLCFESYDPEIQVNESVEPYKKVKTTEKIQEQVPVSDYSQIFASLLKWMANKNWSFQTGERNMFVFKLAGACCRHGMPEQYCKSLFALNFVSSDNTFSQRECERTVKSAYAKNQHLFGTAVFSKGRLVDRTTMAEVVISDPEVLFDPEAKPEDVIYAEDVKERALKIYHNGYEQVRGIGMPKLDELYKKRKTELTLLSGIGNYGKSSFWKWYHLCRVLSLGERYAIFGPEDCPAEEFYHDLVETILGCDCTKFNPERPPQQDYDRIYNFVGKHFFYVYPKSIAPTPQYIKEKFLELVIKEKVDGVLIDPFNQLTNDYASSGGRSDKYLETFLSDCTRFAQQNNVYFDIIAHPKMMHKNGQMNYPCPDVFDLADGAMWNNKCDNILIYHRPRHQENPQDPACEIHTKKIRRQKVVGKKGSIEIEYNRRKRRFIVDGIDFIEQIMGAETKEAPADPQPKTIAPNTSFVYTSSQDRKELNDEIELPEVSDEAPF